MKDLTRFFMGVGKLGEVVEGNVERLPWSMNSLPDINGEGSVVVVPTFLGVYQDFEIATSGELPGEVFERDAGVRRVSSEISRMIYDFAEENCGKRPDSDPCLIAVGYNPVLLPDSASLKTAVPRRCRIFSVADPVNFYDKDNAGISTTYTDWNLGDSSAREKLADLLEHQEATFGLTIPELTLWGLAKGHI